MEETSIWTETFAFIVLLLTVNVMNRNRLLSEFLLVLCVPLLPSCIIILSLSAAPEKKIKDIFLRHSLNFFFVIIVTKALGGMSPSS